MTHIVIKIMVISTISKQFKHGAARKSLNYALIPIRRGDDPKTPLVPLEHIEIMHKFLNQNET